MQQTFVVPYYRSSPIQLPRRDMVLVAAAGPSINIVLATLAALLLRVVSYLPPDAAVWTAQNLKNAVIINVVLAVFNLLPIPPLDGGRVLAGLLPARWAARLEQTEPVGLFIVLGLSALGMMGWLFDPAYRAIGRLINALVGSPA